jgi:hypothetical protein
MNQNTLRQLIKEELTKVINENTSQYKEGDIIYFQGTPHVVVLDNGSPIIQTRIKGTKISKGINRNRIDPAPVKENEGENNEDEIINKIAQRFKRLEK